MMTLERTPREVELEPDIILPAQVGGYLDAARLQPEKRLQLAVLEDAVTTFHRCVGNRGARAVRLLAEVEAWFSSEATDSPFAFVTICDGLDLDPGYIRRGLRRWRAPGDAASARKPRFRRHANGTRHQVLLYVTPVKRIA
jgi:hypothetical protein